MGEIRDHELIRSSVLKHKSFLYVTEFFSGMSVMAVELGASRLLGRKVIDELIEGELDDYRSILDSAGVSGILDLLN